EKCYWRLEMIGGGFWEGWNRVMKGGGRGNDVRVGEDDGGVLRVYLDRFEFGNIVLRGGKMMLVCMWVL
uniref:hypothetical protein n=1 Tax=Neisseria sicca TaxID=490 RepID=UPI001C99A688